MVFKPVIGKEVTHEISALSRRAVKMRIWGFAVGGMGILTAVVGIGFILSSLIVGPSATNFDIDIPKTLVSEKNGFTGHDISIADSTGVLVRKLSLVFALIIVSAALYYIPIKVRREGISKKTMMLIILTFIFALACMLPIIIENVVGPKQEIRDDNSTAAKVTELQQNNETDKFLDYLKSINSKTPDKTLLINYVAAQASIKNGKADIQLVKDVVGMYNTDAPVIHVPGNIRYALEMSALSKPVTQDAVSYEGKKNALVHKYSSLGKSSFFTGVILTLTGLLMLSCVRRLKQRIRFLNSYTYK